MTKYPFGDEGLKLDQDLEKKEIKGVTYDDFKKRRVLEDLPFPVQTPGWNWVGKKHKITDLTDWY